MNATVDPGIALVRPCVHAESVEFLCHIKPPQGQETDTRSKEQSSVFQCLLSGFESGGGETLFLAGFSGMKCPGKETSSH
jgi:hypothetical protein